MPTRVSLLGRPKHCLVTYRNRVKNILGVEDTLELNNKEVHKLLYILKRSLQRLLRDGIVSSWAHRLCNTGSKCQLGSGFNQSNCAKGNPETFEEPARSRHIAKGKDSCNGRGEGNASDTRILPLPQSVFLWFVPSLQKSYAEKRVEE